MKNLIFIFLLASFSMFAQKKKRIIFLFKEGKDTVTFKKNERVYYIENNQTYKFIKQKHKEVTVPYQSIKEDIFTFDSFRKLNKEKKFPDYCNEFHFYIFEKGNDNYGCLLEVDKIWIVENKTVD